MARERVNRTSWWIAAVSLVMLGCSTDLPGAGEHDPMTRPPGLDDAVVSPTRLDASPGDTTDDLGDDTTLADTDDAALDTGDVTLDLADATDTGVDTAPMCMPAASEELACDDLVDNDCDGAVDRDDSACAWWDDAWGRRTRLTFLNGAASAPVEGFPVVFVVEWTEVDGAPTITANEVRFVDPDGTELPYELLGFDGSGTQRGIAVWLRVPGIDASDQDFVWLYRDNAAAPPALDPRDVWAPDYSAVYHLDEEVFDEQSDGVHRDSTASANDASQGGNNDDNYGVGDSQVFDDGDTLSIPGAAIWSGAGAPFTVDLLFLPLQESGLSTRRLLRADNSAHNLALDWVAGTTPTVHLHGTLDAQTVDLSLDSLQPGVGLGYVMVTYDGQSLALYHLGQSASQPLTTTTVPAWTKVALGASAGVGAGVLIDEVHFASVARTLNRYETVRRLYFSEMGFIRVHQDEVRPQ